MQMVLAELHGLGAQEPGVVERRSGIVHAAGTDDHEQTIVLTVENLRRL